MSLLIVLIDLLKESCKVESAPAYSFLNLSHAGYLPKNPPEFAKINLIISLSSKNFPSLRDGGYHGRRVNTCTYKLIRLERTNWQAGDIANKDLKTRKKTAKHERERENRTRNAHVAFGFRTFQSISLSHAYNHSRVTVDVMFSCF